MDGSAVVAFWAVSILFILTPGADVAYAIAAGVRHRSPVPAVAGMLLGHLAATVAVAAGIGALVARAPVLLTSLTLVGAAYLGWLGVGLLRRPAQPAANDAVEACVAPSRQLGKGFGVSALNPKVFLLFLALLPQFVEPGAPWPLGLQMAALGLVHVGTGGVVYLAVGFAARRLLGTRPTAARVVTRVSGAVMVALAGFLVIDRLIS